MLQRLGTLFLLLVPALPAMAAPPSNDTCANALPIGLGTVSGNLTAAGNEGLADCAGEASRPDVWYRLSTEDDLSFFLIAGPYVQIGLYDACPEAGGEASICQDVRPEYPVTADLAAGDTLWVRVTGEVGFNLTLEAAAAVSGRVTDDLGRPVAGARIEINSDNYNITRSDADGRYRLGDLRAGLYDAFAAPPRESGLLGARFGGALCPGDPLSGGCTDEYGVLELTAGEERTLDWELPRYGKIRGRAFRASDGAPLVGVAVRAVGFAGSFGSETTTGADGVYEVRAIPGREYAVIAELDRDHVLLWDGIPCNFGCDAVDGTPVTVEAGAVRDGVDFPFNVGEARIRGRMTRQEDGTPLPVQAQLYDDQGRELRLVVLDADGTYEFDNLGPGTYYVRGGRSVSRLAEMWDDVLCPARPQDECDPLTGDPIEIFGGETVEGIDFVLSLGGEIRGTVRDAVTGEPIDDEPFRLVEVWAENGRFWNGSELDGTYLVPGLLPGRYFVTTDTFLNGGPDALWLDEVWDDVPCPGGGFSPDCDPTTGDLVTVGEREIVEGIDFVLERRPLFGAVSGSVRGGGEPLADVFVQVWRSDGSEVNTVRTRAEGTFRVGDLEPGEYLVFTESISTFIDEVWPGLPCPNRLSCDPLIGTPVTVVAGETTAGLDFELEPGGRINGALTRADGTPFSGEVAVEVLDENGRLVSLHTPRAVRWSAVGLLPGMYFARTRNSAGYLDEMWRGVPCIHECPDRGNPIFIEAGSGSIGVDFALIERQVDAPALDAVGGRFEVRVAWETAQGERGAGEAVRLTDDAGYFWFFDSDNVEIVVKVLDACVSPARSFWVFTAGLTDVGVEIEVLDRASGERRQYRNPLGRAFRPVVDTAAFETCEVLFASSRPLAVSRPFASTRGAEAARHPKTYLPERESQAGICVPDTTSLCLAGGRFRVRAEWSTAESSEVPAQAVPLTDDTGFFWFFSPSNIEVVAKVLDACGSPFDSFWVFAGGLTDVGVRLEITDTVSGEVREWENRRGTPFAPIQDTRAFETCP